MNRTRAAASSAGPGRTRGQREATGGREAITSTQNAALKRSSRRAPERYLLRLYVTGVSRASAHAVERVRAICEEHLQGSYELEVVDIYQLPALAKGEQIVATPTLIRVLPAPLRRYIGNMSNAVFGLDLREGR